MAESGGKLPSGPLLAHSLLSIPITGAMLPLATYLPPIYAEMFGMSLVALGGLFLAERIWGTLSDPLVGWLCDRTRSRFGRRKVWIAAGSALFVLSEALLFFPGEWMSLPVLAIGLVLLFLAWSMITVPYYAWSGELTSDYHERTRVTSWQTMVSGVTLFVVLLAPALADFVRPGDQLLKLNLMGAVVIVPTIIATVLALRAFPDASEPASVINTAKPGWREASRAVLGETVLWKIMLADFAILVAQGFRGGLFIFYVSHFAGLPQCAASLFLLQFVFGIFAAPIWQRIARRIGKRRGIFWAEVAQTAINFALLLVGRGDLALLMALTVLQGLTQGSGNLILRAMLADVADEHRQRTGADRTAMLFSVFSISGKAGSAVPLGIALPLIAWFGFDPQAASNPPIALTALMLCFALGPALAHFVAAWLVSGRSMREAG